jgi:GNAT superfamily N-acetyltransferase
MRIDTVRTTADLNTFITFPWKIYAGDTLWVPPLISDVKFVLGDGNPFWEHAEKMLYLAYDDNGRVVGRIAAIIDHSFVAFQGEKTGFFGFFECVNDATAAAALIEQARAWLASRGIALMRGPMNPSTNDECGFLCDGFDTPPRLMMPHTPRYYLDLVEKAGCTKAKELYAYDMDVSSGPRERLERLTAIAYKKNPGLSIRKLDTRRFEEEIDRAITIYNEAWEKNWGFVPWTDKEFHTMARRLKSLLLLDTTILAEVNGKPVAMLIAVPDYNMAMKKMNGRLFPTGIFKFMYYRKRIDALRLMIMGVVREYRQHGIEGVMYYESLKNAQKLGYRKCEFSWILDDNVMTQRAAEMMGGVLYKKYRIYELPCAGTAQHPA